MRNTPALNNFESEVNDKIVKEIKAAFEQYEASIKDTESSYKLKPLAMQAASLSLSVNKDIVRFFELCKRKINRQMRRKIESQDKPPEFSLLDVKLMLRKNKIDKEVSTAIISAINSPMLLNLSLEDYYTAVNNSSKIYSFKLDCNTGFKKLKNKLKLADAKGIIFVVYGTTRTNFDYLKRYWDIILGKSPKGTPIGFSYAIKHKLKKEKMYFLIGY
jgi:hypothetical protein